MEFSYRVATAFTVLAGYVCYQVGPENAVRKNSPEKGSML
jgi:hypothetical protein